jgi:hypothetical protein
MRTHRRLVAGLMLLSGAAPTTSNAQESQDSNNGVTSLFRDGQRALKTEDAFNGSEVFDVDDGGPLQSHSAAIEVVRFMLPPQSFITPYASAGLLRAWWVLDDDSTMVAASGGSKQFRLGALASFLAGETRRTRRTVSKTCAESQSKRARGDEDHTFAERFSQRADCSAVSSSSTTE